VCCVAQDGIFKQVARCAEDYPTADQGEEEDLLLVALVVQAAGLRLGANVDRRSAVLAAASALSAPLLAAPLPAMSADKADVQGIASRAASGKLTTKGVIGRALRNSLVDPRQLPDCATMMAVSKIDADAANELVNANQLLEKITKAASDNVEAGNKDEQVVVDTLKEALKIVQDADMRIDVAKRFIDDRFNNECVLPG